MATSLGRLWFWLGGLCAGVAYGFERAPGRVVLVTFGAGIGAAMLRRRPVLLSAGLACVAFALGALDAHAHVERGRVLDSAARGAPRCRFEVTVLESEGGLGALAAVSRMTCTDRVLRADPGLVWLDRDETPGSTLQGEGWLVPLGEDGFGRARRRFGAGAELVIIDSTARPPAAGVARIAERIRDGLGAATEEMSSERAGLLRGVTSGDTSMLGRRVTEEFRAAGLSHLVAVSGQNVAMVLGALALLTRSLTSRSRITLGLAAIALFVIVVGPQPSVLRAAAMAAIALAGLGFGSRAEPWHLFAVALIVVVTFRPAIMYSAGLHLSAAATAGLLLWARGLARRLQGLPTLIVLGLAATLSAQFAVSPLIADLFGSVSVVAPLANLLALPAVPPATVLGLCAAVLGAVHPALGRALALLAEPFVAWILWVARVLGSTGWSAVEVPGWVAWVLAAAVLAAAVASARIRRASTLGSVA